MSRQVKKENSSLPVAVLGSKTSLFELPNTATTGEQKKRNGTTTCHWSSAFQSVRYSSQWSGCHAKLVVRHPKDGCQGDYVIYETPLRHSFHFMYNEMLPWSIHWVAWGTCYRKSEGTELCGIEIQHSSLWRIINKREARNIGFWADMLIIFKFPHNFFSPQVCPLSIWQLCNTKLHWSQALFSGVSVRMGDQNNEPLIKNRSIWPKLTLTNANSARYRFCQLALCKTNIDEKANNLLIRSF